MNLKEAFNHLSRGTRIAAVVWLAHLLMIFALFGHHLASRKSKPLRPMIVRTISPSIIKQQQVVKAPPQEKAKATAQQVKKPEAKSTPPSQVAEKSKPTPNIKSATSKKNESPITSLPAPKKGESPSVEKEDELWSELVESLASLSSEPKKNSRPPLQLPLKLNTKAQVADLEYHDDPSYGEFLIAYLQNTLDLPEYGEVKAKIEIDRFGKLLDCKILESKSVKNGEFLKNELSRLDFPCLKDFGIADSSKTFTILFRNIDG
jgi:hypothetical protein